jgi:hypothetical protein
MTVDPRTLSNIIMLLAAWGAASGGVRVSLIF